MVPGSSSSSAAADDRADPGDEAVEGRSAGGGHVHPRVEPARRVAVLEPGEEPFAAEPEGLVRTVVGACDEAVERYCDRCDDLSRCHVFPPSSARFPGLP
jgi:hypothetical protein